MKSVLISINPKWCGLISSGRKTVEVRKTKPVLKPPFKCYIYCTRNKLGVNDLLETHRTDGKIRRANSKIIGEFICDWITELAPLNHSPDDVEEQACLTRTEIVQHLKGKGYAWHISDLVIYDKPRYLDELKTLKCSRKRNTECIDCGACNMDICLLDKLKPLKTPPRSWCYVENERWE